MFLWNEEQRIGKMVFWGEALGVDSRIRGLREKGLTFTLSPISWVTLCKSPNGSGPRVFPPLSGKVFLASVQLPGFLKNHHCRKYSALSASGENESRDLIQS